MKLENLNLISYLKFNLAKPSLVKPSLIKLYLNIKDSFLNYFLKKSNFDKHFRF